MAKPIEFMPRRVTPEEQLTSEVLDSAPALEESLKLLRELHEHGVLDVLIKLVRGGEGLAEGALRTLGSDQVLVGIRSVIELVRVLGALQPGDIRQFAQGISSAAEQGAAAAAHGVKISPLELPKLLMDSDVQLALGTLFGVLKGLGAGLREEREKQNHT